ncbi:RES family NAD+ phosphorylase [Aeromonas rivipollensis]|uniref:RES family NAD+ phosphorylase n=1 Tax=Aeromonas rivipollensis TaxID=948519 RepID=UPI0038D02690
MAKLTPDEKLQLEAEDKYWFEELFYRDLEGWFSSDIACCDECYDDFLDCWPHAYSADKAAFQSNGIGLDSFYSGSRLQDVYTEEEFFKFLKLVPCPRCGSELKDNIWPYELPFDVVSGFEEKIIEISQISQSTPFMLLKHDFAQAVSNALASLVEHTSRENISLSLYRARASATLTSIDKDAFDFPPQNIVSEGRYNHAGIPVLYLASSPETCFKEMRETACHIAEIKLGRDIKLLDLTNSYDAHQEHSDLLSTLVYSALMSAKQDNTGWYKPKYVFSRFVADCALFSGFDAIKYPSTRAEDESFNIVLLNRELALKKDSEIVRIFEYNGRS